MGLIRSFTQKLDPSSSKGNAASVVAQSQEVLDQAKSATDQAIALAADGQAKYTELKDETVAKVAEAQELKATLQDEKVPLQVKLVKSLAFLKGPIGGLLRFLWRVLCCLLPLYQKLFQWIYMAYTWAPKKLVQMVFGAVLCFFGGTYVASLAAIEAFRTMGGERLWADLVYVYEQIMLVNAANDKDEEASGSSVELLNANKHADVAQRKVYVIMRTISEPGRLEDAVGSLWSAYVAVLATLSLQFAQIAALALGMAATVKPIVTRLIEPILVHTLDEKLQHWIGSIINVTLNLLALWVAWTLVAVVASVYSGLRGGRMFADALFGLVKDFGVVERIPEACRDTIRPWLDPDTSLIDEGVMYLLAFAGIYSQIFSGFSIIFPLNLVLFPLTCVEWFLRFQITFGGASAPTG